MFKHLILIAALVFCLGVAACSGGGSIDGPDPTPPNNNDPPDQITDPPLAGTLPAGRNTLMLAMSDGTQLATDVYIPEGSGPWPVMLVRTPYNKGGEEAYALEVSSDGVAYVAQDMRGRWDSQGENIPLIGEDLGEYQDGLDTYTWIADQPWCNGRIASLGGSALGMTQLYSAPFQPPGLACQFIGVAPASMYHEFTYVGGAFRQEQMEQWLEINKFDAQALELYRQHETYNEFWHQFDISHSVADVAVPGMHFGGWFDTFSQGTINSFKLRQHQGGAGARGRQWLVIGPWTHSSVGSTTCGEVELPFVAKNTPFAAYTDFIDFYLKDVPTGIEQHPAVTYYVLGDIDDETAPGNEWRYADDWPVPATLTSYYLHSDGSLSQVAPTSESTSSWTFDPTDPPPTIGGRNLMIDKGIYDQGPVENRADVLVFETKPLAEPLEVTGRVSCRFWVSCDSVDTDVAVRLCDVYPDGRSLLMLDGILRLRYRDGVVQTTLIQPGQVYEIEIDLWSISMIVNSGHRIRLSVCGGNNPRWDVNPGTGERWENGGAYVIQNTALYHGGLRQSALLLPVVN